VAPEGDGIPIPLSGIARLNSLGMTAKEITNARHEVLHRCGPM
jgi:hypothetical protein